MVNPVTQFFIDLQRPVEYPDPEAHAARRKARDDKQIGAALSLIEERPEIERAKIISRLTGGLSPEGRRALCTRMLQTENIFQLDPKALWDAAVTSLSDPLNSRGYSYELRDGALRLLSAGGVASSDLHTVMKAIDSNSEELFLASYHPSLLSQEDNEKVARRLISLTAEASREFEQIRMLEQFVVKGGKFAEIIPPAKLATTAAYQFNIHALRALFDSYCSDEDNYNQILAAAKDVAVRLTGETTDSLNQPGEIINALVQKREESQSEESPPKEDLILGAKLVEQGLEILSGSRK